MAAVLFCVAAKPIVWKLEQSAGLTYIVSIDQKLAHDKTVYWDAARTTCNAVGNPKECHVHFWLNDSRKPLTYPPSPAQWKNKLATYLFVGGKEQIIWSCRHFEVVKNCQ